MLERIQQLIQEVSKGDMTKLDAIDQEFETIIKEANDQELEVAMQLMENFLFSESQLNFEEGAKAA